MVDLSKFPKLVFHREFYKLPNGDRGVYWYFRFNNGYGAVVSKDWHSFDGYRVHYKLMVLTPEDESVFYPFDGLIYTNGQWLEENDVEDALVQIESLPGTFSKKDYPVMFGFEAPIRVFHRLPHGEKGLYAYFQFSNGYGALVVKDEKTSPYEGKYCYKLMLFTPHETLFYPYDDLIHTNGCWLPDEREVKDGLVQIRNLYPAL